MTNPVVVCGANGYTGRLICEFLRQFQVPFVAAGRDRQRVEEAMKLVPGIETAQFEIGELSDDPKQIRKLFSSAKVVCNTVGPFGLFSEPIVQAALEAGCHYLDTTGEQEFMLNMRERYGAEFAKRNLLLAPATAYMSSVLELACEACAEHSGVDTIEAFCVPTGTPTFGSTQTFITTVRSKELYLSNGQLVPWTPAYSAEVKAPFTDRTLLALPWGGTGIPLRYQNDARIRSLKAMTAFSDREMMAGVLGVTKMYHAELAHLPAEAQVEALAKIASGMQPGMPPRENPLIHRNWDTAIGSSSTGRVRYTVYSHSGYQQTGLLQAFAASWLVKQEPRAFGFQSPSQAFGHQNVLGALERFGYAKLVREEA